MTIIKSQVLALAIIIAAVVILSVSDNSGLLMLAKLAILVTVGVFLTVLFLKKIYGPDKAKRIIASLVLLVITVGVCLVAAEFTVRYMYDDITTTADNTSYFALRWQQSHPTVLNRLGFREREFSTEKVADSYRIIVMGDSFAYGQGIASEARFTNIISRDLDDGSDTYEVLNFGRPGAETIDHIEWLDKYILGLSPDFVLLQWYTNDVEGNDKTGRPQYHRLLPSDYLSGVLHRHSALYYLIRSAWGKLQVKMGLTESYQSYMVNRFGNPDSKDAIVANAEIEEFIHRLKARNIPVGIVMFPPMVESGGKVEAYPYGFLFDRMLEICRREAIQCLDLRPVFARVSPASRLWANRLDHHPGALANELAAEAILDMYKKEWEVLIP